MQPSQLLAHRRLDEVALEALAPLEDEADLAVTDRFTRISSPYERIEIDPLTTTLRMFQAARAVAGETVSFDRAWFDQPDDVIAAIEDAPAEPRKTWWWLAVSLAVAAGAVSFMAVYAS